MTSGCQAWRDPLTAGKYLRHEQFAHRHDRRCEQDHRYSAAPANPAHNRREQQEDERASGAEQKKYPGRGNPREIRKALHDVDQPVKAAASLDDARPPAEEQRPSERRCAIHRKEHRDRGDPCHTGKIERRASEKPEAAADGDQAEAREKIR